jgi:hypothetical protein
MSRLHHAVIAGIAAALLAPSAQAQLAAEDVWRDWRTYIESFGYQIEGREERAGDGLVITGVMLTIDAQEEAGGITIAMDRVALLEQEDGSVRIELPALAPVILSSPAAQSRQTRISMDQRQSGLEIVAEGRPGAIDYTYSADSISLEATGFEVNGQVMPPESNVIEVTLETLNGTSTSRRDSAYRYAQDLSAGAVRYRVLVSDDARQSRTEITGQTQSLGFSGRTTLPFDTGGDGSMTAMLDAGLSTEGTSTFGPGALTMLVATPQGASDATTTFREGSLGIVLGQKGVTYEARQQDVQVEMNATQIPLPLSFGVAQSGFNLTMPLRQSETAEDFALGLSLTGVSLPEVLWGMVDPGALLPRDPANLVLDIAGKARLLFDFFDSADVMAAGPESVPVEIENVEIRRLGLAVAGAALEGAGAFVFDNDAVPPLKPKGAVDLTLTGANGLIDRLIAIGLLPEDQAMGLRMMMGLLAVPGPTPDTLTSRIEINDEGHVLANGQRIQ